MKAQKMPTSRTLRQKMAAMAERGTEYEAKFARRWLDAHPSYILSANDIIAVDDSQYGPSEAEAEAAWREYMRRGNR